MNNRIALEPHYSVKEASEYLQCSPDWLRQKLRDRTFAGMKSAGRWRMRESQLIAAMEAMSTEVRPESPVPPSGVSRRSRFHRRMQREAS